MPEEKKRTIFFFTLLDCSVFLCFMKIFNICNALSCFFSLSLSCSVVTIMTQMYTKKLNMSKMNERTAQGTAATVNGDCIKIISNHKHAREWDISREIHEREREKFDLRDKHFTPEMTVMFVSRPLTSRIYESASNRQREK